MHCACEECAQLAPCASTGWAGAGKRAQSSAGKAKAAACANAHRAVAAPERMSERLRKLGSMLLAQDAQLVEDELLKLMAGMVRR